MINNIDYICFKSFSENLNQFKITSNEYKWNDHLNFPNSATLVFCYIFAKKKKKEIKYISVFKIGF